MSVHYINTVWKITKQWRIENYWIDINFSVEELWLNFEWYLAKPKSMWNHAILDSFNEVMRENCHKYVEDKQLSIQVDDKVVPINWVALYWSIMNILISSINDINERWDSVFIVKISDSELRKAKKDRELKLEEVKKEKEKTRLLEKELETEKEKQKYLSEYKATINSKHNEVQNITPVTVVNTTKNNTVVKQNKKKDISNVDFSKLF